MKTIDIYKCNHGKNSIWKLLVMDDGGKSGTRVIGYKCCAYAGTLVHSFKLSHKSEIEDLIGILNEAKKETLA